MASRPHSVQDDLMELRAYLGGHGDIYNVFKRIEEQLQAAKREADMYRADRDEYDALLGRKMAERDGLREQLDAVSASNAAAATLAGEFSVRVKVLQEQLDATRVALDRGAADYVGLLEQYQAALDALAAIQTHTRFSEMSDGDVWFMRVAELLASTPASDPPPRMREGPHLPGLGMESAWEAQNQESKP